MTLVLKQVFSLVKLLHSETGTRSIAAGVTVGWVLGLSPGFSLQTLVMVLAVIAFRIQGGAVGISAAVFGILAYILDPLFDGVGSWALSLEGLRPTWTWLSHLPLVPLTRFNNSVTMGAGLVALGLAPGVYWGANRMIVAYRSSVVAWVRRSRFWTWLTSTRLVQWYLSYEHATQA